MKTWTIPVIAVVLIAAGIFGLVRGEFSYTEKEHEANVGELELSFKEKESVDIPKWLAGGAIALGALLLLVRKK